MAINVDNLPTGEIPPEVARAFEQFLKVEGRVEFPLKPTKTSAISTSAEEPSDDIQDAENEVNDLIDSVEEMENLVEQLEDLADELTKDMNIPIDPDDKPLKKAVQRLGGNDAITQPIFKKAKSIVDNAPDMTFRQSPVVAALTGDGHIDGPWMECSQVTAKAADFFNLRENPPTVPEEPVNPRNQEIFDDFEGNLADMILHILLMLWWNMIWPKFIVDLGIIDPLKLMIAYPLDSLIGFFKPIPFKPKGKQWIEENGRITKALKRFRVFLLCRVPYKLWSTAKTDYDPIVEINPPCPAKLDEECEQTEPKNKDETKNISSNGKKALKQSFTEQGNEEICANPKEYGQDAPPDEPTGLGMPPECLQYASRIIRAVEDASYSSKKPIASSKTLETNLSTVAETVGLF